MALRRVIAVGASLLDPHVGATRAAEELLAVAAREVGDRAHDALAPS